MSQINCLRCKTPIDSQLEQCPSCGERVTLFQRTYSTKLLDGKYQDWRDGRRLSGWARTALPVALDIP